MWGMGLGFTNVSWQPYILIDCTLLTTFYMRKVGESLPRGTESFRVWINELLGVSVRNSASRLLKIY